MGAQYVRLAVYVKLVRHVKVRARVENDLVKAQRPVCSAKDGATKWHVADQFRGKLYFRMVVGMIPKDVGLDLAFGFNTFSRHQKPWFVAIRMVNGKFCVIMLVNPRRLERYVSHHPVGRLRRNVRVPCRRLRAGWNGRRDVLRAAEHGQSQN